MRPTWFDHSANTPSRYDAPVTTGLMVAAVIGFLLGSAGVQSLSCTVPLALPEIWRAVLYPLIPGGIFGLIFFCLWLNFVGRPLEGSWGSSAFLWFWVIVTVAPVGAMWLTALLIHRSASPWPWLPLAALMVAWAMIEPEMTMLLFGLLPVKLKWLAAAAAVAVFGFHVQFGLVFGLAALLGLALAARWTPQWSARGFSLVQLSTRPRRRRARPLDDRPTWRRLNPLEWIARARRRRQFERLMKD